MSTHRPATPPEPGSLTARSGRVRQARRLTARATRGKRREFLAEGPQAIREAITSGVTCEVFATGTATRRHRDLAAAAARQGVAWHVVGDDVVEALSETVTPQGLVARCAFVDVSTPELLSGGPRLLAVLHEVRDPGNAGTVLRCADASGADGVVLSGASVDPYNAKAVRASAGSLFHVPLAVEQSLADVLAGARQRGLRVLAADAAGDVRLDRALDGGQLGGPTAWLFGNEARGLPDDARSLADAVVSVPILGRAESLNLATAVAVCLYASALATSRQPPLRRCANGP